MVVGRGNALEGLQAVHGGVATLGLVRDHATDGAPEHLGRRTVVPGTTARRVETSLLAEEGLVLHCVRSRVSIGSSSPFSSSIDPSVRIRCVYSGPDGLVDVRLARKNSPEMLSCSQRTTTTFWPFRSCLATVEARRPRRWPFPSTTTCENQRCSEESSIHVSLSTALKILHSCVLHVGRVRAKIIRGRGCVPQARRCSC